MLVEDVMQTAMVTISPRTSLPGGDGAWPTWCMLSRGRASGSPACATLEGRS
jgi:hypothetical protein